MKRINLKIFFLFTLIFISCSSFSLEQQKKTFSRLLIFGDSLSDVGNTSDLFLGFFPKSPPYAEGRLSNGNLWIEHFSQKLNLPSELVLNYAFAGARANQGLTPIPAVDKQINQYLKWNRKADPTALYVIWIGANDIMNDIDKVDDSRIVDRIIEQVETQIVILIKHGVKNLLVPNLPAISLTPLAYEQDAENKNSEYSEHIDKLVKNYNQTLDNTLYNLSQEYPQTNFIKFDAYTTLQHLPDYAESFGITNLFERCNPNGYMSYTLEVCSDPDTYLYWDKVHPSATGHYAISYFINNLMFKNGYSPAGADNKPSYKDLDIYYRNNMAINELTAKKLNINDYEAILNETVVF